MKATISNQPAEPGRAPYIQLLIEFEHDPSLDEEEEFFQITFRAYPVRVFVAIDDQRDNPFSGQDLDDCFLAPAVVVQRILKQEFDPWKSFSHAMVIGEYIQVEDGIRNSDNVEQVKKYYSKIEPTVKEWMKLCGIPNTELDQSLPDHYYHDNPNY